ncbi:MAG: LysR substrate-binding domain-containing protein [Terriglobales bacterium]
MPSLSHRNPPSPAGGREQARTRPEKWENRLSKPQKITGGPAFPHAQAERRIRCAGLMPNVALEVDTIETARRMVDRGLGMAFLPQLAVGQERRSGKLATLKLLNAEPLGRALFPQLSTTQPPTPQDVHRFTGFGTCAKCIRECKV